MQRLTQREGGLFPRPTEIEMDCTCPDWAGMCKHVAAVLYGVGARLDTLPELLFTLRNVDHRELIRQAAASENLDRALDTGRDAGLAGADLGELFGIDIDDRQRQREKAQTSSVGRSNAPQSGRSRRCRHAGHRAPPQAAESETGDRLANQGGRRQIGGGRRQIGGGRRQIGRQVGCPAQRKEPVRLSLREGQQSVSASKTPDARLSAVFPHHVLYFLGLKKGSDNPKNSAGHFLPQRCFCRNPSSETDGVGL